MSDTDSQLTVAPMASKRDWRDFVDLPYRLHRGQPGWIPPLRAGAASFLSPRWNPYFSHAEAQYFLAKRGGKVVGRIIAHIDHNLRRFQKTEWGLFGFLEVENDDEAATALLATAERWLTARQCEKMVGPMEFSTSYNIGLRIEGYDCPTTFFEPFHPPYYRDFFERYGLSKAIDTVFREGVFGALDEPVREQVAELTAKAVEHGVTIRRMRKSDALNDLARYLRIVEESSKDHWGFVPLTEREVFHTAAGMSRLLDERWALLAEREGEVVGAALSIPDYNQCLAHMQGRMFPLGWAKFRYYKHKIDRLKGVFFGIKPEHQHLGIAAALIAEYTKTASETGIERVQVGWSLETNEPVNRAMEGIGLSIVKRYRVFQKDLAGAR